MYSYVCVKLIYFLRVVLHAPAGFNFKLFFLVRSVSIDKSPVFTHAFSAMFAMEWCLSKVV